MAEQIISCSGIQYGLIILPDGAIAVSGAITVTNITGSIVIGSVSANVESIYVQSGANIVGSMFEMEGIPTSTIYNNPSWKFIYSGNSIGSVYQFIGTGSYCQILTYSGNAVTNLSSWQVV